MVHARNELEAAGFFAPDADEWTRQLGRSVLRLIEEFASEGHSGMSAAEANRIFAKLAAYEPLTPLTGNESEWVEVGVQGGEPLYQNKRHSTVFKQGLLGDAYDIEGYIFEDSDGVRVTNYHSRRTIDFPYMPKRTLVKRHPWWRYQLFRLRRAVSNWWHNREY